eukprot:6202830-Pleurochrysis_carterae.AAC.4
MIHREKATARCRWSEVRRRFYRRRLAKRADREWSSPPRSWLRASRAEGVRSSAEAWSLWARRSWRRPSMRRERAAERRGERGGRTTNDWAARSARSHLHP